MIVRRHLVDLAVRHLDVEAVDLVELHAQVGDAGAGAFAGFQVEQEGVAVLGDAAQFVQLCIETRRDDASVAQQHRRLFGDRHRQQGFDLRRRAQRLRQHLQQHGARVRHQGTQGRQGMQGDAQAGQFAWPHLPQGDAGRDALDIADRAQRVAQSGEAAVDQHRDRVMALAGDGAVAQRVRQPVAQAAAAHAGAAGIDQRQQRGRVLAAQRLRQFEVAVRRRRQVEQVAGTFHLQPAHMHQRLPLRVFGIAQQCRGGRMRHRQIAGAEARQG